MCTEHIAHSNQVLWSEMQLISKVSAAKIHYSRVFSDIAGNKQEDYKLKTHRDIWTHSYIWGIHSYSQMHDCVSLFFGHNTPEVLKISERVDPMSLNTPL